MSSAGKCDICSELLSEMSWGELFCFKCNRGQPKRSLGFGLGRMAEPAPSPGVGSIRINGQEIARASEFRFEAPTTSADVSISPSTIARAIEAGVEMEERRRRARSQRPICPRCATPMSRFYSGERAGEWECASCRYAEMQRFSASQFGRIAAELYDEVPPEELPPPARKPKRRASPSDFAELAWKAESYDWKPTTISIPGAKPADPSLPPAEKPRRKLQMKP